MIDTLFEGQALWFSVPALAGTGVFLLLLVLMFVGADGADGLDGDPGAALDGADSSGAFEILSVQGISAFLMGFGWVGIGGMFGAEWAPQTCMGAGVVGGISMVWLLGSLLNVVRGLESSGNISIAQAVGRTGEVYANIPERGAGQGQIRLVLSKRQRTYNAVSVGPELPTRQRVVVLEVNDDNSLTVGPESS